MTDRTLKKLKPLVVAVLTVCFLFAALPGCGSSAPPSLGGESEGERFIPYPKGYVTDRLGASAYRGAGNANLSPYYGSIDVYHLTGSDRLTILPRYKTYQQTTEYSCGPAAALMVLHHYGNTVWDELAIAKVMETNTQTGTPTSGMVRFFTKIGWQVQSSLTAPKKVIGKNTLDCMKGGMIYGNAASIDGMIERMEEEKAAIKTAKTIKPSKI